MQGQLLDHQNSFQANIQKLEHHQLSGRCPCSLISFQNQFMRNSKTRWLLFFILFQSTLFLLSCSLLHFEYILELKIKKVTNICQSVKWSSLFFLLLFLSILALPSDRKKAIMLLHSLGNSIMVSQATTAALRCIIAAFLTCNSHLNCDVSFSSKLIFIEDKNTVDCIRLKGDRKRIFKIWFEK